MHLHVEQPLPVDACADDRDARYRSIENAIHSLIEHNSDWVAALATTACELHHGFEYFHWTGFYRVTGPDLLQVGPYQGGHGCLEISFDRGICGAAASTLETQRVDDVTERPEHIACSTTTVSEIVVPVVTPDGTLLAVLDVDSDLRAAFTDVDQQALERICSFLGQRFASLSPVA